MHPAVKPSDRLRLAGRVVLACGLVAALLTYWIQTRNAQPAVDELAAGYLRARDHQMGQLMGGFGVVLTQWTDMLQQPIAEALLVAAAAAVVAWMCFRLSASADEPENW